MTMRINANDVQNAVNQVNEELTNANSKNRVFVRKHGYNSINIVELHQGNRIILDNMFNGTKTEVYDYLKAMVRMSIMLSEKE